MKTSHERIAALVAEHLVVDPSTVTPQARLADLGADSLDKVELIMAIEDEFDIDVEDEWDLYQTVADLQALVPDTTGSAA